MEPAVRWDAAQYERFARERSRPFLDLLARVGEIEPRRIADLGCGTGELTRLLLRRWPRATVWGVDSSLEMLERARRSPASPNLRFVRRDLRRWRPTRPLDLIVSNAVLQWLPSHGRVLESLAELLGAKGTMAVQIPNNRRAPASRAVEDLLAEPRWRTSLARAAALPAVEAPRFYAERLGALGFQVDLWETTYHHRLAAAAEIVEWLRGTTLRPILTAFPAAQAAAFLAALKRRLRTAYPADARGVVFPFQRIFFVATRRGRTGLRGSRRDPAP
ncbi:MAG TPA: methyltransferase domain-containing protein [Candidatus Polarisedimenticolia bacterium]|jgi:trans-aconitate 2-methyltransferase|nr:methyltransferase domain-containing protein [Candidatus Polarisedimenticolia bacterium]